jgi:hypothetical protein
LAGGIAALITATAAPTLAIYPVQTTTLTGPGWWSADRADLVAVQVDGHAVRRGGTARTRPPPLSRSHFQAARPK